MVCQVVSEALGSQIDRSLHSASIDMAVRYMHSTRLRPSDQVLQTVGSNLVGPPGCLSPFWLGAAARLRSVDVCKGGRI